jgi:outer membrane protein
LVPAAAQIQIGVVDFQQALLNTAEMKKEADQLEQKYKPRDEEINKLSQELQELQKKLQSASPQEAAQLQADGARKQRDLQRLNEDLQADLELDRNTVLQNAGSKMRAVIEGLAKAKNLDLVTDVTNTYYFKAAMDLTAEATAAYDKAHPVAGQP